MLIFKLTVNPFATKAQLKQKWVYFQIVCQLFNPKEKIILIIAQKSYKSFSEVLDFSIGK